MYLYIRSRINNSFARGMLKNSSQGSVSMEYIIVSSFALLMSVTAVTWLGKIIKDRMTVIASKIHAEPAEFNIDLDPLP